MMEYIGTLALPIFAALIILCGIMRDIKVFECFTSGGSDGIKTAFKLLPILIATIVAVQMLSSSGILDMLSYILEPVANFVGLPSQVIPLVLLHPFSGSGANALLISILKECGPDSYAGMVASVICASSETTIYAIAVYFGSVGIKKTRFTVAVGLLADAAAAIISGIVVRIIM